MTDYRDEDDDIEIEKIVALLPDRTINVVIQRLVGKLFELLEKLYNETDGDEILKIIGEKISSGDINKEQINDLTFFLDKTTQKKIESGENGIRIALTYTYAAIKLEQNKSMSQAWQAISEARYHIGYCQAVYDASKKSGPSERAQKGGAEKNQKKLDLKVLIIKHLENMRPKNGWKGPSLAAETIVDSLTCSLKEKKNRFGKLDRDDLKYEIINLIMEDAACIEAYNTAPSSHVVKKIDN